MEYNQRNITIEEFAKNYIDNHPKSYTSSLCLISNILNVAHVALMQLCIVSLPHSPRITLVLLLLLELLFTLLTLIPYCFLHKFISVVELLSKITKSLCIGGFFCVCMVINISSGQEANRPINQAVQSLGMIIIFLGISSTYIFTFIKLIQVVIQKVKERKAKKKKREEKTEDVEDLTMTQRGLIFYKEDILGMDDSSEADDILNEPLSVDHQLPIDWNYLPKVTRSQRSMVKRSEKSVIWQSEGIETQI